MKTVKIRYENEMFTAMLMQGGGLVMSGTFSKPSEAVKVTPYLAAAKQSALAAKDQADFERGMQ